MARSPPFRRHAEDDLRRPQRPPTLDSVATAPAPALRHDRVQEVAQIGDADQVQLPDGGWVRVRWKGWTSKDLVAVELLDICRNHDDSNVRELGAYDPELSDDDIVFAGAPGEIEVVVGGATYRYRLERRYGNRRSVERCPKRSCGGRPALVFWFSCPPTPTLRTIPAPIRSPRPKRRRTAA